MTLLSICQDAAVELGLPEPSSIVGSADPAAKKLLRYANAAGKQLMRYHDWQGLIVEQTFTTLNQQEQTNALPPADYDRMIYNPEVWDRTSHLRITGPVPQRYWQSILAGLASGTPGYWRIIGNQLNVLPVMDAGHTLAFEYISKRWAVSSLGSRQEEFLADSDTTQVPVFEELLTLELIWRFRQSRGFAQYAEDMSTCEREKEKAASNDRGTGRIRSESQNAYDLPQQPFWPGYVGT